MTWIFLLALSVAFPIFAEEPDVDARQSVGELKARVIPTVVHLGDEVRLVIQAHFPKGYSIEPFSTKIAFAPFELRSIDKPTAVKRGEHIFQTVTVRLAVFQMGEVSIPSIPVALWNVAGQRAEARTPPIPVRVVSVAKKKGDTADIRPIKGPAAVSLRYLADWLLGGAVLLLSACLVFLILRRRKKNKADAENLLPPDERLDRELGRLRENDWLSLGKTKEHYSELSDILRRYLERRFGLEVMEHTSDEIKPLLKEKISDRLVLEDLREILEKTDLVKFARFMPERALAAELEKRLVGVVQATKLVPEVTAGRSGKRKKEKGKRKKK